MAETKTISVKIDHKLYIALKTRAELDNSNVSDEIRSLLRSALAAEGLDLYGNEVAGFIRGVVDARMDVAALDIERKLDATEDRIAAVLSRPMTAAIMAGLMSADVLKASYASLDDVPVAEIWKNYLAQAGELSRAGLGVSVNIFFTIFTNVFSPIAPTRMRRIRQRGCAAFGV